MNRKVYILFLLALLFSCDNSEEIIQLNPTEMEVRVLDASGNIVRGAEVSIYRNSRDWSLLTREVDTQITDENGVAYFTDLLPVNYYYFVSFERNGSVFSNQQINYDLGDVGGSNYVLADFLTDNAITRVTVNAIYEKLTGSQINEVIISDVNLYFIDTFDDLDPENEPLTLDLATLVDYDPFADDLDVALFDDRTFYDQVELFDREESDIGAGDFFLNQEFSVLSVDDFFASTFTLYEYDDVFFFSEFYNYFPVEATDFTLNGVQNVPHKLVLGEFLFGNDIYLIEVILDYQ